MNRNSLSTIGLTRFNDLGPLAVALGKNNTLEELEIQASAFADLFTHTYRNQISIQGFGDALENNTHLETLVLPVAKFFKFKDLTDAISALGKNHTLKSVTIQGMTRYDHSGVLKTILPYEDAPFVTALCKAIAENDSITYLNLDNNGLGNDMAGDIAKALKVNKTIRSLSLFDNLILSDGIIAFIETLKTNHTLTTIDLSANGIKSVTGLLTQTSQPNDKALKLLSQALAENRY